MHAKFEDLLIIAPHFGAFVKDQTISIRPHFKSVSVIVPIPRFSKIMVQMPHIRRHFSFLRFAIESLESLEDISVYPIEFSTLPLEVMRKRNCFLAARSCAKILSRDVPDFDLVHAHFLENGFVGAAFKNLLDIPLIVTAHGGDVYNLPFKDVWYNSLARYVFNKADATIAVSRFNADKLLSLGIPSKKLHVIPNGYDERLFTPLSPQGARRKVGLPLNKKILLSVGNLVDVKGHTYLIDAMQIVLQRRNDTSLVIIGAGLLEKELRKKAQKLGLSKKILFVGEKKHEEIPMWMNACDLFVLPSLSEGFPTVVPEAMACGKPTIGTCVGGVPEAITCGEFGMLVPPGDTESLSQAILEGLVRNWSQKRILDEAKKYSWSNISKQIIAVYGSLVGQPQCVRAQSSSDVLRFFTVSSRTLAWSA